MQSKSPAYLKITKEFAEKYPDRFGTGNTIKEPRRVRTPSFEINRLFGGGLPANRLNIVCGYPRSFKSTFVIGTMKNLLDLCGDCTSVKEFCTCSQFNDNTCIAYIDVDQTMDISYINRLGIDGERVLIYKPIHGESACETAERFSQVPEVRGIVIDTVNSLVPMENFVDENSKKGYMDSMMMGERAKLIRRICLALVNHLDGPVLRLAIIVNHLAKSIDRHGTIYLPGGRAQEEFATTILQFWPQGASASKRTTEELLTEKDKAHKEEVGFLIRKSKVGNWNISGEFKIYTDSDKTKHIQAGDIDDHGSVANWALRYDLIQKNSGRYMVDGKDLGPQQIVTYWRENPQRYIHLQEEIIKYEKAAQGW